jgi:hypothetical protein
MKRFLDSEFFTDKTTLILRKIWLVLSLPVCVFKRPDNCTFFTSSNELFTADFSQ